MLHLGPEKCKNFDSLFDKKSGRQFTEFHLKRILANGTKIEREWIVYSPSRQSIFCFVCRLFSSQTKSFESDGFNDWKNSSREMQRHERSQSHLSCDVIYRQRAKLESCVHTSFESSAATEADYWRKVLLRIVEVIKFLCARNLAIRGNNEVFGSNENGNFLGILELLSKFDPFLESHLSRYGTKGRGNLKTKHSFHHRYSLLYVPGRSSYLSKTICEEFISLIAQHVKEKIISEVIDAHYYSISVDSTPDVTHTDQLSFCIRFVKDGSITERFLAFILIHGHTADYLTDTVLDYLKDNEIDIMNCRGLSTDNASNMSGQYNGLQSRIREVNDLSTFVPCCAHSLNLVGHNSITGIKTAVDFFSIVERTYEYFVKSTYRWNQLSTQLNENEIMLKRATGTRWSAKSEAIRALHSSFAKVISVLVSFLADYSTQDYDSKAKATGLVKKLCRFEHIFMLILWKNILSQFNRINLALQKSNLTLSVADNLYQSLIDYMENLKTEHDTVWNETVVLFEEAKSIAEDANISIRSTRSNIDVETGKKQSFDSIFLPIIYALLLNLNKRHETIHKLNKNFSFLLNLKSMNSDQISIACKTIASIYTKDINGTELTDECILAKTYFTSDDLTHESMYETLYRDRLCGTFPNLDILLRMYLCLFVSNVSTERSFSKLKLIKNYLRNSMADNRLNSLALLSIESSMMDELKFDDIIETFVQAKRRKIPL